jgi:hypothetical protein
VFISECDTGVENRLEFLVFISPFFYKTNLNSLVIINAEGILIHAVAVAEP